MLRGEKAIQSAAVIDCDVHQGNGTAAIFATDPAVFTFSVHGANNFPFRKESSSLDIALLDGAGDDEFLIAVDTGLRAAWQHGPDILFYIAGADAHEHDRLGRLRVTAAALAERDRMVLGGCAARGIPAVVVMGGGYGTNVEDTVAIHLHSVLTAASLAAGISPISTMR